MSNTQALTPNAVVAAITSELKNVGTFGVLSSVGIVTILQLLEEYPAVPLAQVRLFLLASSIFKICTIYKVPSREERKKEQAHEYPVPLMFCDIFLLGMSMIAGLVVGQAIPQVQVTGNGVPPDSPNTTGTVSQNQGHKWMSEVLNVLPMLYFCRLVFLFIDFVTGRRMSRGLRTFVSKGTEGHRIDHNGNVNPSVE